MTTTFYVFFYEKRTKAIYAVTSTNSVNEVIKLDYKIPLIEVNIAKFHTAKKYAKKTIEEDSTLIDFYKQAYSNSSEYNYDNEDYSGDYIYADNKKLTKSIKR